jgi:hypothetical protein
MSLTLIYKAGFKFLWLWDVFFTFVDNTQLKMYMRMKDKLVNLLHKKHDINNLEDFDSWDKVQ